MITTFGVLPMATLAKFKGLLLCACGAILLCWVAFFNGFPLIYADTGTYLESGFTLETPLDRPITYGILIWLFSLNGLSLWTVILLQTFLLMVVLWLTIREFTVSDRSSGWVFTITSIVLAFLSALPVIASEVIADIFTAVSILSFFLLVFGKKSTKTQRAFLYVTFTISVACHISHVLIVLVIALFVLLILWIRRRKKLNTRATLRPVLITSLLAVVAMLSMMSSISKSRHVFTMGHLVETGILNAYLDDHCGLKEISLCKYRDRIPPGAETFIWNSDGDSVLLLTGGWLGSKEEYSEIISETYTTGKYLKMHIVAAISGTARQLYTIRAGEGLGRYDTNMLVSQRIRKHFPQQYSSYLDSRQSADEFAELKIIDPLNKIVTAISLLTILSWIFLRKRDDDSKYLRILIAVLFSAYVLNCAICATFATVANRFGARLSWLAIFLAILLITDWIVRARKRE